MSVLLPVALGPKRKWLKGAAQSNGKMDGIRCLHGQQGLREYSGGPDLRDFGRFS